MSERNLVLIGMPGCGKTTVGRATALDMGRAFIDLDEEIERAAGLTVAEIFEREGEEGFREREYAAASRWCRGRSLVIATGGGTVKRADSMEALGRGGTAIWLLRPLPMLAMDGRPLSRDRETLQRLEAERAPLYARYSLARANNDSRVEDAVRRVRRAFEALERNK